MNGRQFRWPALSPLFQMGESHSKGACVAIEASQSVASDKIVNFQVPKDSEAWQNTLLFW